MKKINNSGFAAVEAILIVIIIAIIGGTGYYVYHTSKKSNDTLSSASQVAQSSPSKITKKKSAKTDSDSKSQITKSESPDSSAKYLVIKEWGVGLPLSSGIKDAYYIYDSNGYVRLGTRSLTAADANCAPNKIGTATLSRQTAATRNANAQRGDPSSYPVNNTKIGNYYYGITHAQAACGNTIYSSESKQQAEDIKLFDAAFKGVRTAQ